MKRVGNGEKKSYAQGPPGIKSLDVGSSHDSAMGLQQMGTGEGLDGLARRR